MGGTHAGNSLQRARVKAGITQEEAAEFLHCGTRTIQSYESGRTEPSLTALRAMVDCYRCELADLFPDGGNEK